MARNDNDDMQYPSTAFLDRSDRHLHGSGLIQKSEYAKNSNSCIFRFVYQIDMKFVRQLRPVTETSWVVSYGGKTIPRWRTAAILKIDISPYLSEKSSDFDEILYTAADFELDERHVIKNDKVTSDRLLVRQNVFLVIIIIIACLCCL